MSETSTEAPVVADAAVEVEPETFSREYVEQLRKENAKYRTKATESTEAAKAAEKARLASMSEAERAVAEAEARGRSAVIGEYGQRLARAEYIAAAARRNPGADVEGLMEDLNLAKFVGEDGQPDLNAIAASVARVIPESAANPRPAGNADLGARTTAMPLNGDDIENALRKKLGIV